MTSCDSTQGCVACVQAAIIKLIRGIFVKRRKCSKILLCAGQPIIMFRLRLNPIKMFTTMSYFYPCWHFFWFHAVVSCRPKGEVLPCAARHCCCSGGVFSCSRSKWRQMKTEGSKSKTFGIEKQGDSSDCVPYPVRKTPCRGGKYTLCELQAVVRKGGGFGVFRRLGQRCFVQWRDGFLSNQRSPSWSEKWWRAP